MRFRLVATYNSRHSPVARVALVPEFSSPDAPRAAPILYLDPQQGTYLLSQHLSDVPMAKAEHLRGAVYLNIA